MQQKKKNKKPVPKLRERVKRLQVTPFNYHVTIVITTDVRASAERRDLGELPPAMYALHAHNGGMASLLILPLTCGVNTIGHEVSHVVWNLMRVIGAEYENEIIAYLQGYLCGEVADFMSKHRPGGWKHVGTKH